MRSKASPRCSFGYEVATTSSPSSARVSATRRMKRLEPPSKAWPDTYFAVTRILMCPFLSLLDNVVVDGVVPDLSCARRGRAVLDHQGRVLPDHPDDGPACHREGAVVVERLEVRVEILHLGGRRGLGEQRELDEDVVELVLEGVRRRVRDEVEDRVRVGRPLGGPALEEAAADGRVEGRAGELSEDGRREGLH